LAAVLAALGLLLGVAAGAAAFDTTTFKLCAGDWKYISGLDSHKRTKVHAKCVPGTPYGTTVNWSVDVIATQGGGPWGWGFQCADYSPSANTHDYSHATDLQYSGQTNCVILTISQE
jgi:hypothetical protein